jgi:hypothetical protein
MSVHPAVESLKLNLNGGKLTGTLTYSSTVNGKTVVHELPITNAKLEGNEIFFNYTHPPTAGKGPNADYVYDGKISGESIKGTSKVDWMDHTFYKIWQAERVKP